MNMTQTRSATQTATLTKVVYVTRKAQADLFALVDTYGQITEQYALDLIHDLRLLLDEEVIDRIEFNWTLPGTNQVVGAYSYTVISAGIGLVDDRAGGIRYNSRLQAANFGVQWSYNDRWRSLADTGRQAIRQQARLGWGAADRLDYSRGYWNFDRTYAKEDFGLNRGNFTAW